ncbi:MAG: response regulator [Geobacteraceae bacterium]|nr:response regulator [Geobacteraceae bacterium]
MMATIMFVDDEAGIRNSLKRLFADSPHNVLIAASAAEGLELLRSTTCAVIVSDNQMPGESGIEFLYKARQLAPDTVRVMMTAYADLGTALNAINHCEAYRFVVKPWDNQELVELVNNCIMRYELLQSLRLNDEAIYRSLAQAIELKDHYTRGHCDRVVDFSLALGKRMGVATDIMTHLMHGAMLHDCGKIGVPEATLNFPGKLDDDQMNVIRKHPDWGGEVARAAGMHQITVNVILYHHEHYNGKGYPTGLSGNDIPLEARIVAVADVYDALASDRPYRKAMPPDIAMREFLAMSGTVLDPLLVESFLEILKEQPEALSSAASAP